MEGHGSLTDNRSLVIKKVDKEPCVVVCDGNDYLIGAEKQLSDKNVYKEVKFNKKLIWDLTENSNKLLGKLKNRDLIPDKELKYFSFDHRRVCNLYMKIVLPYKNS